MITQRITETADIKQCPSCSAGALATDIYCRKCGVRQTTRSITAASASSEDERKTINLHESAEIHKAFSGPLVNVLTQAMAAKATALPSKRFGVRVVQAIITIPIWLLIILLSPMDAYLAARTVSSQINCQ